MNISLPFFTKKERKQNHRSTHMTRRHIKEKKTHFPKLHAFIVIGGFFIIFSALWFKVAYLQIIEGEALANRARRQQTTLEYIPARRGDIVDRNGFILARSVEMQTIIVKPALLQDLSHTSKTLANILQRPEKDIRKALSSSKKVLLLARQISDSIAEQVKQAQLPGVTITTEYGRVYPNRELAGILLGFVGNDGAGLEGIEYVANSLLEGQEQKNILLRDARGKKLFTQQASSVSDSISIAGKTVTLTIDMNIQHIAEEALLKTVAQYNAKWGGALVVEVASGDILAYAEVPRFNPNTFKTAKASQWKNRLATDSYEPGSSFKVFLLAAALEENIVQPDSIIFCEGGSWQLQSTIINDDNASYQWLSLPDVFAFSSNIGMAKIGLSLGIKKYKEYLIKLGFGSKTELPLPQSTGITRFNRYWSDVDIATLAFGQGISVTGLQLAQATLTIANGGLFQPLRIFKNDTTETYQYRIFSEKTIEIVRSMMRRVVVSGTGKRAAVPGLDVGGKTGTAQKAEAGTYGDKRFASFIGMFPIEKPEYIVVVMIDEPKKNVYGGVVASPTFQSIASQMLSYKTNTIIEQAEQIPLPQEPSIQNIRKPIIHSNTPQTTLPNILGMSLRKAFETVAPFGIIPTIYGKAGVVIKQNPLPGTPLDTNTSLTIWLSEST